MNDNVKTIAFLSVAVAAVGLAFITTPEGRDSASADNSAHPCLFQMVRKNFRFHRGWLARLTVTQSDLFEM